MEPMRRGGRRNGTIGSGDLPERRASKETGIMPSTHLDPPRVGSLANRAPRVLREMRNLVGRRGGLLTQVQHGLVRRM
eukprot:8573413-Alexandrium_andersonii.AAC.1